jgi:hypothetical protein
MVVANGVSIQMVATRVLLQVVTHHFALHTVVGRDVNILMAAKRVLYIQLSSALHTVVGFDVNILMAAKKVLVE